MTGQRLEAVECKLAFIEELVEQLNGVVTRQQQQIDDQHAQLALLRNHLKRGDEMLARVEEEAPPPHY